MATAVKKTISLPPDLAAEAETLAKEEGKTLSAVIQDALKLARQERLSIEPVCRGSVPNLQDRPKRKQRSTGKKSFTKKHHKTAARKNSTGGEQWQRQWMKSR